jgi:PPK2 family polyphosphate:nucleotide phosphotransferase
MTEQALVPTGGKVNLALFSPDYDDGMTKKQAAEKVSALAERFSELQTMFYANRKNALLIILQAMDAGGKDGTIRKVFAPLDPQGVRVIAFKKPSEAELAHDFLWRVHQQVPPKGMITVFNRSHYEDVLIVRVNKLVSEEVWRKRYDHINAFEKLLTDSGTIILKFFLHISKDEQKKRLQDRLDDPTERWKFAIGDLPVREKWHDYQQAYEDALALCHTEYAPWHIIPANKKWYRNYIITRVIMDKLESLQLSFPAGEVGLDKVVIPD